MKKPTTPPRETCYRRLVIRHRGKVIKQKRERIPMTAALHELGGDAETNHCRLRAGATLKRQKCVGKVYPVWVRFEYTADFVVDGLDDTPRTYRMPWKQIDPALQNGPTL